MTVLRLDLLGGLRASRPDGSEFALPTRKAALLFAYLALAPGQTAPRSQLMTMFWGSWAEAQARGSLRQALFALRRVLGELDEAVLHSSADDVCLGRDKVDADILESHRLCTAGDRPALEQASGLYRGELLAGAQLAEPEFEDWLAARRRALRTILVNALERLARHQLADGDAGLAESTARRLLDLDPLREASCCLLMETLAARGERNAALREFAALRDRLLSELGVEPEPATQAVYRHILEPVGKPAQFPGHSEGALTTPEARDTFAVATPTHRPHGVAVADRSLRPVVAVLPFTNMSGEPDQEHFADGLTEDIITGLAAWHWFPVTARHSSLAYKGKNLPIG